MDEVWRVEITLRGGRNQAERLVEKILALVPAEEDLGVSITGAAVVPANVVSEEDIHVEA